MGLESHIYQALLALTYRLYNHPYTKNFLFSLNNTWYLAKKLEINHESYNFDKIDKKYENYNIYQIYNLYKIDIFEPHPAISRKTCKT